MKLCHLPAELALDYPMTLDRPPEFINKLLAEIRRKGSEFLTQLARKKS